MKDYELTLILDPEIADENVPATLERIHGTITARGGEVLETDNWGRKRLAYPIKKRFEGNYFLSKVRMEPASERELERALNISEDVLRHLVILARN
jgi:small subunit ribosomal protein S6